MKEKDLTKVHYNYENRSQNLTSMTHNFMIKYFINGGHKDVRK